MIFRGKVVLYFMYLYSYVHDGVGMFPPGLVGNCVLTFSLSRSDESVGLAYTTVCGDILGTCVTNAGA